MRIDNFALLALTNLKLLIPLSCDGIEDILLFISWVHCSSEAVLLARHPATTAIVDLTGIAGRRGDVGLVVQLYEWSSEDEPFDVQIRKGNEVFFPKSWERIDGVTNLFDMDGRGEGSLLRVVSMQVNVMLFVSDSVGGDWWMVALEGKVSHISFER